MKTTKKLLLTVTAAYLAVALVTVCADIVVQYRQNYADAPYVNADPSAVLTADELLFKTPEEDVTPDRAPYLLGWLRSEDVELYGTWHYRVIGLKARDARTEAEAELIEDAGYHIFTTEENAAFDALLRQMRFRPLKGMRNILTHRKAKKNNFVASFRLRTFYAGSEYGSAFSSLPPITLFNRNIRRGEIFTVGNKTYLAGCFSVGGIYNEAADLYEENPAVQKNGRFTANPTQYSLFEIEPSDALTELLAQKETFRGGENERVSRYAPFYPQHSAKIALLIETALFALAILLLLTRKKKLAVRLLSLSAAFLLIAGGTLAAVLHGDYMALFRPSVYANAQDNLFSFDELFSDVSQELLDYYKQESEWQPVITVSHRLQFVDGGTSYTPEEKGGGPAGTYADPDWRSRHFSKADVDEFAGLLRELKYLPVKGVKSVLTAARMTDGNAFGYFIREGNVNTLDAYYFEDEPCWPCVVWRGQFFTAGGHTWLLACFRMDRDLGAALDAKYRQKEGFNLSFAVFEIAPGDALDRLLEKQDDFRGEPHERWDKTFYYNWFPSGWLTGEAIVFALAALAILFDRKKSLSTVG